MAQKVAIVTTERIRIENLSVEDLVAMGRAPYTNWVGHLQDIDREIVGRATEAVGMGNFAKRDTSSLSDGELQRVMIARAIAQQTPIILLDEPTAFLDIPTRFEVCRLLADLAHKEGKTILFSTHDVDSALPVCDSFAIIDDVTLRKLPAEEAAAEIEQMFRK
jgi:iron complex transport system ATP-binding protein